MVSNKKKNPNEGMVVRQFFIDNDNSLLIASNDRLIKLKLILKGDRPRRVGVITKSTRTIAMKRKRNVHLFRKGNAYGFNDYILREAKHFDWIRLKDDAGNDWKIPRQYILDNGRYLMFKEQGFERQRFVSLEEIEQFRVHDKENRRF